MTKDYYKNVKFPELSEDESPTPVVPEDELVGMDVTVPMTEIRRMVTALSTGQSTISKTPFILKNSPFLHALKSFEEQPTKKTMFLFLDLAGQDVNRRFKQECELVLKQNSDKLKEILDARDEEIREQAERDAAAPKAR